MAQSSDKTKKSTAGSSKGSTAAKTSARSNSSRSTGAGSTTARSTGTKNSTAGRSNASGKTTAKSTQTGTKRTTTMRQLEMSEVDGERVVKEKYVPTEKERKLQNEIKLLVVLTISVLLFLSNFGLIGVVGDFFSDVMFGLFGYIAWVFPVLLFLGVAFFVSNFGNSRAMIKLFATVAVVLFVCSFIQLIIYDKSISVGQMYINCSKNHNGGGLFGGIIAWALYSLIGRIGAFIVVVICVIICMVIITERSFIGGVKKGSKKVYSTAAEEVVKLKENAAERAEEKEYLANQRMNKKVRGVNISKVGDQKKHNADVHEINSEVENASVFRGHVDVAEISNNPRSEYEDNIPEEEDYNPYRQYSGESIFRNTMESRNMGNAGKDSTASFDSEAINSPKRETVRETVKVSEKVQERSNYDSNISLLDNDKTYVTATVGTNKYFDDEMSDGGEGEFHAKEQILVSKSAVNAMKRKAFDVGVPSGVADTTGKADFSGMPESVDRTGNGMMAGSGRDMHPEAKKKPKEYYLPDVNLLAGGSAKRRAGADIELRETANNLKNILENFGVKVTVNNYSKGPSVTRYELQPEVGTRLSKITSLADDIKLNLAATDIRIEAPIPGKSAVGIEVPNATRESVLLRELIESEELKKHPSKLAFAAGKDIAGKVIVEDIAKMPHMLIAGTTGSGKSVFTNSIIMTILFRAKPSEVQLLIIDPKVVEFGVYNGIPHLRQPVVTDPKLAANTLKWAVNEMSERYKKFAELNVRDLKGYNEKLETMSFPEGESRPQRLPQILIVIDELADLMMAAAKEVEESICRLAQLARAAGIHLIIATQRPSVDVVTGLIKANIPSRTALMVSSGTDSRTILDTVGAEKLLGNGDMLFYPASYVKPVRLQGAFVSDEEVQKVVNFWSAQAGEIVYDPSVTEFINNAPQSSVGSQGQSGGGDGRDEYFADAGRFITDKQKASISSLQRVFKIGFTRAARIIDQLEEAGVVGAEEGTKPRNVLMTKEEFEEFINQ